MMIHSGMDVVSGSGADCGDGDEDEWHWFSL